MEKELRDKGAVSLCVIKEASLSFMADLMNFAVEWTAERGMKGLVDNTPEGYYELIGLPIEEIDENLEPPQP
jgi:hypothetical protein